MSEAEVDDRVRARDFEFIRQQRELYGEILSHPVLLQGFEVDGRRVPLLGPQGIFKPAILPGAAGLKPKPAFLAGRYEMFRRAS